MSFEKAIAIPPIDLNLITGAVRFLGSVVNSGDVVLDTPHPEPARWLYISVTGDVSLVKLNGETQVYQNLLPGIAHPFASLQVNSTGTTASGLVWGS